MTKRELTPIDKLANSYLQEVLDITPEMVTYLGMPGACETQFSDYSPNGEATQADLLRRTLKTLDTLPVLDKTDQITADSMRYSLGLELELIDQGESGAINNINTPLQGIVGIFDNMKQDTATDWQTIIARIKNVPQALQGWQETLLKRAQSNVPLAAKQIELAIDEAKHIASEKSAFNYLADTCAQAYPELQSAITESTAQAKAAYMELAKFLAEKIAPHGVASEAFGEQRYALHSYQFVGAKIDFAEYYAWAEAELARIISEQEKIAHALYGQGVSVNEAMERLNHDPARQIHGSAALQQWMQETSDAAIEALSGTHFDIPEPLRKLECMIAPSGSGAIYYTGPTDDFSRGGRMWWAVPHGTETFTTWQEKTTVYHEGVPGHHLQIGYTTYLQDSLNNWRRHACWTSGYGEGWALYAEGLMVELGFMEDLGDRMGVLDGERLRTARVMLDIGVHCQLPAPAKYQHISPIWNRDVAWAFLTDNVAMDHSFLSFELNRYLGWAGQAPSYKIGHRIFNQLRQEASQKAGANFDLKQWHTDILSIGSVSLDVLRKVIA